MTIYTGSEEDDDFIVTAFVTVGDEFHGLGGQDTLVIGNNAGIPFYSFGSALLNSIEHLEFTNTAVATSAVFNLASHPFTAPGTTITGSAGSNAVLFTATTGGDFTVPTLTLIGWTDDSATEYVGIGTSTSSAVTLRANEALASAQALSGGSGNDTLIGHSGLDLMGGGLGNDTLQGLAGDDIMRLTNNNLTVNADYDQSGDTLDGGIGEDIAAVSGPVIAGTLTSIEHVFFLAAGGLAGAPELILHTSRNAGFLADANFVGAVSGTVTLNFDTVDYFDGSGITFEDQVFNGNLVASNLSVAFNFMGNDNANSIVGSSRPDTIVGGGGADILNGGAGADLLYGGVDNDTYVVDDAADLVFENSGEGIDEVQSSTNHYLFANVENLFLFSSGDLFGVGNDLDNWITGNAGSNLLIGGEGSDGLYGEAGNDLLFGQGGADAIFGGAGIDYIVGGADPDNINGGDDADAIYGEDGEDLLDGGDGFFTDILVGGAGDDLLRGDSGYHDYDLMDGGSGNDTYYVDTGDDLTFEAEDGGIDLVYAIVSVPNAGVYLYPNVENLLLGESTAFGVGNELANELTGSGAANWLLGGAGNDTINGKGGDDVLFGEAGSDSFVFDANSGADVIGDFNPAEDTINLDAYNFASFAALQATFEQVGADGAIHLGNGNLIVLHNVTMANLDAGDFIL